MTRAGVTGRAPGAGEATPLVIGTAAGAVAGADARDPREEPLAAAEASRRRRASRARTARPGRRTQTGTGRLPRWRLGTAGRLAALHAALLALVLGIVGATLVSDFSSHFEAVAGKNLVAELNAYVHTASSRTARSDLVIFSESYLRSHPLPAGVEVVIAIPRGGVVGSAGSQALIRARLAQGWLATPPRSTVVEGATVGGRSVELLAAPVLIGGRSVGTLLATYDLASLDAERSKVISLAIAEGLIALAAGVASAYLLLRRVLRTIGRITDTASEIERGELDRRLGDQGTDDEVGRLAGTFDSMIERVSKAMTSQRRLLSDVSHQLRTPLTVARGHLEVLQRTGLDDEQAVSETVDLVVDELDHMKGLVERLLLLGQAMEPDFLAPEQIDVRSFVADLFDTARVLAPRRWVLSPLPDCVVEADAGKLRGALFNLVDNAVKATAPGETIGIGACLATDGSLVFTVEDAGPGIPPAERGAVLVRFARPGARAAGGSGLGLAIAKAVAEAHGGALDVGDSRYGGCAVDILLPATLVAYPSRGL